MGYNIHITPPLIALDFQLRGPEFLHPRYPNSADRTMNLYIYRSMDRMRLYIIYIQPAQKAGHTYQRALTGLFDPCLAQAGTTGIIEDSVSVVLYEPILGSRVHTDNSLSHNSSLEEPYVLIEVRLLDGQKLHADRSSY